MDENEKKSYIRSIRRWSFVNIIYSIGLLYFLDGLPLNNLDEKTILDMKLFCSDKLSDYLNAKSILLTIKISQSCLTAINVGRNLLILFYISTKFKNSKTATEMMSIKAKWIDSGLAKCFKTLQELIQIGIIIYAIYNIFWRSSSSSPCNYVDLTKIDENLSNNVIIALLGNVFSYYFKVFSWMTDSFYFLSVQFECEKEKKDLSNIDIEAPEPKPRQKRKDKRNKQKKDQQTTHGGWAESEEDNMQKPLLYAPPAPVDLEPVKQYAKQTYQPDDHDKPTQLYQPYQSGRTNQMYQPYQPEKQNQLYKPYQPN